MARTPTPDRPAPGNSYGAITYRSIADGLNRNRGPAALGSAHRAVSYRSVADGPNLDRGLAVPGSALRAIA